MALTTSSLILTVFPTATTSSFPRRNLNFPPNYNKPTAAAFLAVSLPFHRHRSATCRPKLLPVRASDPSKQMGDNGSKEISWFQPIFRFAGNNVLPLVLISSVALGLTYPNLGCALDKYSLSKFGPFGIFVISGLMLRSEEISAAVEAWPVGLFGLV
ncbi:hypothetical protein TanjilG_19417 [Lupinus angustifolius]|uniref:Uncharacterized protein n=2 Tax=Lupinus angustifolius TaxID=3871 RepID=A0A4P1R4N6_LUPAN|nr:hypothetical protein TanjilG_19417 [Lupinus angustifolius]